MMSSKWRIDSNRILVGGDSAGAIAALSHGYMKNVDDGSSGNPGYSSHINGVLSISGEMKQQAFCSGTKADGQPTGCIIKYIPLVNHNFINQLIAGDVPV